MPLQQLDNRECQEGRHQRRAFLEYVATVENCADNAGKSARPADAALFESTNQRGLGVARGRVGAVADRLQRFGPHDVALRKRWQPAFATRIVRVVVAALDIHLQKPLVHDHRAGRRKLRVAPVTRNAAEANGDGVPGGVGHLRGQRALPNELVQPELVTRKLAGQLARGHEPVAGRPNRLVRLLRVLDFLLVTPRRVGQELAAVQLTHLRTRRVQRRLGQRRGVGTHVGDVAVFVEPLGDSHRRLRRKTQLAARLLLQRARHERRGRRAAVRLAFDRPDDEIAVA